jgi:hypothetical protein
MIKKSFGLPLTSSYQTLYEVPTGKKAEWALLYVTNTSGSTSGFSVRYWNNEASTYLQMFDDYSLSANEFFKIGGAENEFVALKEGDRIEALDDNGMTALVSVIEYNDIIQGG